MMQHRKVPPIEVIERPKHTHVWCQLQTVDQGMKFRWCSLCGDLELLEPKFHSKLVATPLPEGGSPVRAPYREVDPVEAEERRKKLAEEGAKAMKFTRRPDQE